ncbi:hypothetical protein W97_08079 [Coniosporium apollinis CBS 100218]|uniref:Fungal lipase-type domain-containing protein n=1 Tax=Coniosporium apollinis (strain CBS 100218) TaxID=1168221 RepID=R7Z4G0_CONA1|nr:uncharacterized protein W97_08079 [Coniosporium apollinis CBS 100218]EON68821.1 hypothetical protein W97_08079 [Coniosporium apollinis CBS 100218]
MSHTDLMAQSTLRPNFQIIKLCARLAKFAYTSGNPALKLSSRKNNDEVAKTKLLEELHTQVTALGPILDFQRYYSHSWFIPKSSQPKWFRSYAYFCHIKGKPETGVGRADGNKETGTVGGEEVDREAANVKAVQREALEGDAIERPVVGEERSGVEVEEVIDRIIMGFRGTWNDSTGSGRWFHENEALQESLVSRFPTWITNKLTPSSKYGFSDFYYDAMVIRIPYRKGTVWKWYAYWGSLILERTGWARRFFTWPRTVAGDWMTRPNEPPNELNGGHVHLGFWSLWASPEGFAGYNREGCVSSKESVLHSVRKALKETNGRKTDVYVVGHSLGGAVSSFAALDIAEELKEYPNATMYHVTFGSPPVGTAAFASYFSTKMDRHQSWSISHERDMIPQCFSWCASKWYLRPLNWWGDWSCVGEKRFITKLGSREPSVTTEENGKVGIIEKCKWGTAGLGALGMLYGLSIFAIPISGVWYFCRLPYYKSKKNPPKGPKNTYGKCVTPLGENVGLEYHSLQRYIDLMENENDLENSIYGGTSGPTGVVGVGS